MRKSSRKVKTVHPGEILREEFLLPNRLTPGRVAKAIFVPRTRIERVVEEKTPITSDTAVRLAKFFGNTAQFWLNLQSHYDLDVAARALAKNIEKIEPFRASK